MAVLELQGASLRETGLISSTEDPLIREKWERTGPGLDQTGVIFCSACYKMCRFLNIFNSPNIGSKIQAEKQKINKLLTKHKAGR